MREADIREDPAHSLWRPDAIWRGSTAFVLASGPSARLLPAERLRAAQRAGARVLAVNSTVRRFPTADAWFFTDDPVWERHRDSGFADTYAGLIVTLSKVAKRDRPERVKLIQKHDGAAFTMAPLPMKDGRSSGHRAVSLAINLGAVRVALVGFDLKADAAGRTHEHDDYLPHAIDRDIFAREFVPAFSGWNEAAERAGVTVVNCTPDSALTEFPFADLGDELERLGA